LDYARQLLEDDPDLTGKELAEMCGRSPRWGRLRKSELLPSISGNGGNGRGHA
jgi:hypothetical protein